MIQFSMKHDIQNLNTERSKDLSWTFRPFSLGADCSQGPPDSSRSGEVLPGGGHRGQGSGEDKGGGQLHRLPPGAVQQGARVTLQCVWQAKILVVAFQRSNLAYNLFPR